MKDVVGVTTVFLLLVSTGHVTSGSTDDKTFGGVVVTTDTLNNFIAIPGAGTVIFVGLLSFATIISYILGGIELVLGLPGYGDSRALDGGSVSSADTFALLVSLSDMLEERQTYEDTDMPCRKRVMCKKRKTVAHRHLKSAALGITNFIRWTSELDFRSFQLSWIPGWMRSYLLDYVLDSFVVPDSGG